MSIVGHRKHHLHSSSGSSSSTSVGAGRLMVHLITVYLASGHDVLALVRKNLANWLGLDPVLIRKLRTPSGLTRLDLEDRK